MLCVLLSAAFSLFSLCAAETARSEFNISKDGDQTEAFWGNDGGLNTTSRQYSEVDPRVVEYSEKFLSFYKDRLNHDGRLAFTGLNMSDGSNCIVHCDVSLQELPFSTANEISIAAYGSRMKRQTCGRIATKNLGNGMLGCRRSARYLERMFDMALYFIYLGATDAEAFAPVLHAVGYAHSRSSCDPRFKNKAGIIVSHGFSALYELYWPMLLTVVRRRNDNIPCDPPSQLVMDQLKKDFIGKRAAAIYGPTLTGNLLANDLAAFFGKFTAESDMKAFRDYLAENGKFPPILSITSRVSRPLPVSPQDNDVEGRSFPDVMDAEASVDSADEGIGQMLGGDETEVSVEAQDASVNEDVVDKMGTEVRMSWRHMRQETRASYYVTTESCNKWVSSTRYNVVRLGSRLLANRNMVCCSQECTIMAKSLRLSPSSMSSCCFGCNKYSCQPFNSQMLRPAIVSAAKSHFSSPVFSFGV